MKQERPVIFFDGGCKLCNGSVAFVLKHDRKGRFLFATLQSAAGQAVLSQIRDNKQSRDSIVYLENEKIYLRSTAILKILKRLGGWWKFLYVFMLIPAFLRNAVYDIIARNRHRWFGRTGCILIPPGRLKS
jgi:predicted DCC family thiol-disulfide oxidoreductase YuxK